MTAAALRVQCAWRCKQGRFALMLKRRAKEERDREERQAAVRLQNMQRSRLAKRELARRRAAKEALERAKLEAAALRVQCTWRCKQGRFALMLKRRAREERDREERHAAIRLQSLQRSRNARREAHRRRKERAEAALRLQKENACALRIQTRYRAHKGSRSRRSMCRLLLCFCRTQVKSFI